MRSRYERILLDLYTMGILTIVMVTTPRCRLPISSRILRYFEDFTRENILEEKDIIRNSKVNVLLSFMITITGGYLPSEVYVLPPKFGAEEQTRLFSVIIPADQIIASDNKQLKIIELFKIALEKFFVREYKKTNATFMEGVWKKLDIEYLLSIPYPAPPKDIKYLGEP